jgi:hypothetical protein
VKKARLSAERQITEFQPGPEIKNDEDILKKIIEDSKRLRGKSESVTSNSTLPVRWQLHGGMAATLTDPLVIGTIGRHSQTALIEAATGWFQRSPEAPKGCWQKWTKTPKPAT